MIPGTEMHPPLAVNVHGMLRMPLGVACTLAVTLLSVTIRLWFVDGLLRPVTIDGPSMAPTFCGAHFAVDCADCGFPFRCDAEDSPTSNRATCPNCGFGENELHVALLRPPDRVLIDSWPHIWRQPAHGEVVAARGSAGVPLVKRVVAVPPEQLSIESGDLYVDGQLMRKSLFELREVHVLVHDNSYQSLKSKGLPPRWRPASEDSRWKAKGSKFQRDVNPNEGSFDWLQYHHWPCTADLRLRGVDTPVLDYDSFNQGDSPRELNIVHDVLLNCRLRASGNGELAFAAADGGMRFEVILEPGNRVVVRSGTKTLLERTLDVSVLRRDLQVEFGLCDQQVLLGLNGRALIRMNYERPARPQTEALYPLAIGVRGLAAEINGLRVWRDIYYLDPQDLSRPWKASGLSPEHFALLGDNSPVSIDSRHWDEPGVSADSILGRVYRPFWAASP